MTGKREKRERRGGLAVLAALLALALLLSRGNSRGAAVSSPAEPEAPEEEAAVEPAARTVAEAPLPDSGDAPLPQSDEEPVGEPSGWEDSVPEGGPVEDSYFDDAVFLGDSRTDGFQLYSGLSHGTFLYATGATVESVFSKAVETPVGTMPLLDALSSMDCGKIYLMLGVNELGWNGTDIFRTQSEKLLQRLREDHPDAVIVIQSLLPVSAAKDAEGRYVNNDRIDAYNQVWMDLAQTYDAVYLNVAEAVAGEDGKLPEELCFDGVHLNPAGCRLWLDYLRTHPVGDWEPAVPETEAAGGEADGAEAP